MQQNSRAILIKTIIRLGVILIFSLLFLAGIEWMKYLLVFYLFILFFGSRISAVYFLILLLTLPFLVYFKKTNVAEYYAIGAYMFLAGEIAAHLAYKKLVFQKIFLPLKNNKVRAALLSLIFVLILILPSLNLGLENEENIVSNWIVNHKLKLW